MRTARSNRTFVLLIVAGTASGQQTTIRRSKCHAHNRMTSAPSRPPSRNMRKGVVLGDLWKRPGLSRARPQHRHGRGAHRSRSDRRTAVLSQSRARQWREAGRDLGNHHASCVLHRLGQRHGRRSGGEGRVQEPQYRSRSAPAGFRPSASARRGGGGAAGDARRASSSDRSRPVSSSTRRTCCFAISG